jgi:phosphoserine phosphatase RsbU/P
VTESMHRIIASHNLPPSLPLSAIEKPLRDALANSQVVLFTQDLDLRYTWIFNPHLDFTPDHVLGKTDSELLPAEDARILTRIKSEVLASGQAVRETVRTTRDGSPSYYDLVVEPQRDALGSIVGVVCASTDVTAHVLAMDERRFQSAVLESIHDSVIVTDLDGRITYWNRGAEDIFGYRAGEMLGQTPAILYPDMDPKKLAADLSSIAAGNDYQAEWRGRCKDGKLVWLDIRTTALHDAGGRFIGFVGVGEDITERRLAEEERDRVLRRERNLRQRLQHFLAMVAHEQRQGITVVLGHAQLLARRAVGSELEAWREPISVIERTAAQMRHLIDDLGDAAVAGEGQFAVSPEPIDLAQLVYSVVAERQALTGQHQIVVEAPERLDGEWDPMRLRQLVGNLVDNAIKYSPEGGEVIVRLGGAQEGQVLLAVSDDGIGITAEQQEQLFDLFYRTEEVEDVAGFGLGLYLCRAIVEAHGGQIAVESEPGEGSTFFVTLPIDSSNA